MSPQGIHKAPIHKEEFNGRGTRLHSATLMLYFDPTTYIHGWPKSFLWVGWAVTLVGMTGHHVLCAAQRLNMGRVDNAKGTGGQ